MSTTTFSTDLADTVPAVATGVSIQPSSRALRAAVHRGRDFFAAVADVNETYGVIEAACMLVAAAFGTIMLVTAFGFRL